MILFVITASSDVSRLSRKRLEVTFPQDVIEHKSIAVSVLGASDGQVGHVGFCDSFFTINIVVKMIATLEGTVSSDKGATCRHDELE